jgi:hypothetical protein
MALETSPSSDKNSQAHRLTVYEGAPAETLPPKHWTELPDGARERYLSARPRLRHLILAGFYAGTGLGLALFVLWLPGSSSDRTLTKTTVFLVALSAFTFFELFRAWRAK